MGALLMPEDLDAGVVAIEEEAMDALAEARRFMCPRCRRRSVVSYQYHQALWPKLGLTPSPCRDAYYGHLYMRQKKAAARRREAEAL